MGCFSEVQQFLNFLETFPGNFGTIWPRFQIVGKFGSMKSTEDILYYLTSGEMKTFSKRFIIQICSAQLAYNFMLTRFEVKTSNTSLTSFPNTSKLLKILRYSLLGVWKCDQTLSFVFDILLTFFYIHTFNTITLTQISLNSRSEVGAIRNHAPFNNF